MSGELTRRTSQSAPLPPAGYERVETTKRYWLHGDECWEKFEDWLDEEKLPYCAMTMQERLDDDETAEPSTCTGRWVVLVDAPVSVSTDRPQGKQMPKEDST